MAKKQPKTAPTANKQSAKTPTPPPVQPVTVDGRSRRSDNDALEGHFVDVVDGPHKGLWGVFDRVLEYAKDGYPSKILVRNRDHSEGVEQADVEYAHARPSKRSGGR